MTFPAPADSRTERTPHLCLDRWWWAASYNKPPCRTAFPCLASGSQKKNGESFNSQESIVRNPEKKKLNKTKHQKHFLKKWKKKETTNHFICQFSVFSPSSLFVSSQASSNRPGSAMPNPVGGCFSLGWCATCHCNFQPPSYSIAGSGKLWKQESRKEERW